MSQVSALILLVLLALSMCHPALGANLPDQVSLTGDMNIVVSAVDQASFALNMSLLDVTRDMYKVFGYPPVATGHNDTANLLLANNSVSRIYIGTPANAPYFEQLTDLSSCLGGPESHCLRVVPDQHDPNHMQYWLLAIGADVRGAIYAAFSFSEHILGVDPMYRFTDIQPEYQQAITINVSDISAMTFASPQFEYRVIFANDEDLLGGFTPDPLGESVFSLTTFNWLYETTLRLKANAFLVGTVPYPDEKSLTLASRRGLVVTNHHFNLLGINTFRWPAAINDEWSWSDNPATMAYAWKASVSAMTRLDDVIWSVGYRGLNDYPAPCAGCSSADKGKYIGEVIGNQTDWVREIAGGAEQKFITYMWAEGLGYLQHGYLNVPKEVSIILTDAGPGHIFGLDDYANISDGVYTHVAMYNGHANQLTEMVPPSRHFDQLGTFVKTGRRTKYIILNTSDLRPVPLTTEAIMRFAWDPKPFMTASTPDAAQTQFITQWCKRQYGVDDELASQIAQYYNDYFAIPYVQAGSSDNQLSNTIIDLADAYGQSLQKSRNVTAAVVAKAHRAIPASLDAVRQLHNDTMGVYKLTGTWAEDRRNFFVAHLLGQSAMQRYGCEVQNSLAQSIIAMSQKQLQSAVSNLSDALSYYDDFFTAQRNAETSHWRGLFMHSHLADFQRGRSYVRLALVALKELSAAEIQLPAVPPRLYYTFTYYQLVNEDHYPLFYASQDWNMHNFVRISCSRKATQCYNNATGGYFHDTAYIYMKSLLENVEQLGVIHYTVDGSAPTSSSPAYSQSRGLVIHDTTHIKAVAIAPNVTPVTQSEATFTKV